MPGGFPIGQDFCNANFGATIQGITGITPNATAFVKGATFTTIIASTVSNVSGIMITIFFSPSTTGYHLMATDIAIGAANSERVIIPNLLIDTYQTGVVGSLQFYFPIQIPYGTRISARIVANVASADANNTIVIQTFDSGFTGIEGGGGVDSIGFTQASITGTQCTPNASPYTKGTWAPLVTSTQTDYQGFSVCFDGGNTTRNYNTYLMDIGIGASNSERVLIPNMFLAYSSNGTQPWGSMYFPIYIPRGQRLSARVASGGSSDTCTIGATIYGVYL